MRSTRGEGPGLPRPWQSGARAQLLAAVLGVLPLYSGAVILQLRHDLSIPVWGFIVYLGVVSPLAIVVAFLLLRFLCGEYPRALNLASGRLAADLVAGLLLAPVIIVANVVAIPLLSALLTEASSNPSVAALFAELAGNSGLLILFVGLLIPMGAASEELIRAFLLSRLWKVWPSVPARLAAVFVSACLFGSVHLYQGPVHIAWAAVFGLIMGLYYLKFGRVVPLILAHYVTNALQVVVFAF
jgi:membrane protease YdiL (CAAX protease family)